MFFSFIFLFSIIIVFLQLPIAHQGTPKRDDTDDKVPLILETFVIAYQASISRYIHQNLSVCLAIYLKCPPIYLLTNLSIQLSTYLNTHIRIYLLTNLPIYYTPASIYIKRYERTPPPPSPHTLHKHKHTPHFIKLHRYIKLLDI